MPVRYPDEFRQRAIEPARTGDQPVAQVAADLDIATSCLRRWMKQDDIDGGRKEDLNTDERAEGRLASTPDDLDAGRTTL